MVVFHVLVDTVHVVYRPCVVGSCIQHILAKGEVRLLIAQHAQNGWHDIYLLCNLVLHLRLSATVGFVNDDRHAETAQIGLVESVVTEIGMVACQYEDGILEPWLTTCRLEEAAQSHIGIAYALMYLNTLFWIGSFIFLRHGIRVVTGSCEYSCHEWFLHLRHLCCVILQEGLVPDSPCAVELILTSKTVIVIKILATVVILETSGTGECLEAHGTALGTVEESCLVTLVSQDTG